MNSSSDNPAGEAFPLRAMASSPQSGLPHARYERFESMREYDAMFDELIPQTQRLIRIFDRSLGVRYNASSRCDLLRTFLRADPLNRLFVVVHDMDRAERDCPRFTALLQRYGHIAKLRQTPRVARHLHDPFVIFDASHYLHRFHYDHMRFARGLNDVEGTQTLLERFDELWEASRPAATGGVVGL